MMIQDYTPGDRPAVERIYRRAYAGEPWCEELSCEEVARRWESCTRRRGFKAFDVLHKGKILAFTCIDAPTLEELERERGSALAKFVGTKHRRIVWIRETCVDPVYQGLGIARFLKKFMLSQYILSPYEFPNRQSCIVLTRHRKDNIQIIRLSRSLGFVPTGICVPSSQVAELFHEYWFRIVSRKGKS